MSYPQPDSDSAVLNGFDFFRLNTPLVSPGDIYESKQGSHQIVMGPDCDFSQIQCNYYNGARSVSGAFAASSFIETALITSQRGLVGAIAARNDPGAIYAPSQRLGRILFHPANLFDPMFQPDQLEGDPMLLVPPTLDVIQYFASVPSVTPQRNDKDFYFQALNGLAGSGNSSAGIGVPYYGRKYAYVEFVNPSLSHDVTVEILGVNFSISPGTNSDQTILVVPTLIAAPGTLKFEVKANTHGMFDYLVVLVFFTDPAAQGNTPLRIRVSDNPG